MIFGLGGKAVHGGGVVSPFAPSGGFIGVIVEGGPLVRTVVLIRGRERFSGQHLRALPLRLAGRLVLEE